MIGLKAFWIDAELAFVLVSVPIADRVNGQSDNFEVGRLPLRKLLS
jgi:hypothetical protein